MGQRHVRMKSRRRLHPRARLLPAQIRRARDQHGFRSSEHGDAHSNVQAPHGDPVETQDLERRKKDWMVAPALPHWSERGRYRRHSDYGKWPPERMLSWAQSIGPSVREVVEKIFARYPRPELGYRPFLALTRDSARRLARVPTSVHAGSASSRRPRNP